MVVFPNAKINLGLNIVKKRADGYHEIRTCFVPIPWKDALEMVEAEKTTITTTGIPIPDDGENIVMKAYHILKERYALPPVSIHLHKHIPVGAGLGGGSSDGAFALKLLNELFSLSMSEAQLSEVAAALGADCAFFIKNRPALAEGIGEKLSPLDLSLNGKFLMVVNPGIHIATARAYGMISPKEPLWNLGEILSEKSMDEWEGLVVNDFEKPLFEEYPELAAIKRKLYENGALYAAMSGSGSSIYGFFDEEKSIDFHERYQVFSAFL